MSPADGLPDGWVVWSDEADDRVVYAYRPDVFDATEFPAACLPVCYLTRSDGSRQPGRNPADRSSTDEWLVTLYLEPTVVVGDVNRFDSRDDAESFVGDLLTRFADGTIDYREAYQLPREEYLDRLDELTGSQ